MFGLKAALSGTCDQATAQVRVCWEDPVTTGFVTAALQRANERLVDAAFVSMECVRVAPTSLAWNIVLMVEVWIFGGLIINVRT